MTTLFDPKVDYVFKKLFGCEKKPSILISFLNACIKPEKPITKVNIKNTELTKEYIEESFSRLDVLAETEDGEIINIEMQRADENNMIKRSLFYWSKLFASEYKGRSKYSLLPRTICINVLDFKLLDEEYYHNVFMLKNKSNNNLLTDTMEIHFVEIPKMKELNPDDVLSLWTAFLDNPNDEKLIELENRYEELHEARIELTRISRDPKEAQLYRMREDAINEKISGLTESFDKGIKAGIKKGIQKGIEEGINQEKINIAKNLLDVLDNETISLKTGLSIYDIQQLRN